MRGVTGCGGLGGHASYVDVELADCALRLMDWVSGIARAPEAQALFVLPQSSSDVLRPC